MNKKDYNITPFANLKDCYHSFNVPHSEYFERYCEWLIIEMSNYFWKAIPNDLVIINPNIEGRNYPQYLIKQRWIALYVEDGLLESKITYQLAHEMCHFFIVSEIKNPDLKFFEESLCETASHFFLKLKGNYYLNSPNIENKFGNYLLDYSKEVFLNIEPITLSASTTHHNLNREENRYIAHLMLPIFENYPSLWSEVPKLADVEASTVGKLLASWKNKARGEHKRAIQEIQNLFK